MGGTGVKALTTPSSPRLLEVVVVDDTRRMKEASSGHHLQVDRLMERRDIILDGISSSLSPIIYFCHDVQITLQINGVADDFRLMEDIVGLDGASGEARYQYDIGIAVV